MKKIAKTPLTKEQKKEKLEIIRSKLICHLNNFWEEVDEKKHWIHEDGDMLFVDWYAFITFEKNDELTISFDLDCAPNVVAQIMYCLCWNKIRVAIYDSYYASFHDKETYWEEKAFEKRWEDQKREVFESEIALISPKGDEKLN